jgi:hypothetical protein
VTRRRPRWQWPPRLPWPPCCYRRARTAHRLPSGAGLGWTGQSDWVTFDLGLSQYVAQNWPQLWSR